MNSDYSEIVYRVIEEINLHRPEWAECVKGSLTRVGDWSEPRPDYVFLDTETDKTIAVLCADSHQPRDYYDNKINNTVKILNRHSMCIIIVPEMIEDEDSASYILSNLSDKSLDNLPLAVIEYEMKNDQWSYNLVKRLNAYGNALQQRTSNQYKSFWCWWRDASHYEVYDLLKLSQKYDEEEGDIYTQYVYPEFYQLMIDGKTKQWNGKPRTKSYSESGYKSEKQNYKIPLVQLGLWDTTEGRITSKGKKLLAIGDYYGPESEQFFNALSKAILIDGKHLDLIRKVYEFQRVESALLPESSSEYFLLLDDYLTQSGYIGTRKPTAVTTGAKNSYIRDEPKLWNKLGFIEALGRGKYYKPFKGIIFNWDVINKVLLSEE